MRHTPDPPMLTKTPAQSLSEQLADRLAHRIRDRLLAPGARLPSVRECARLQGVSPSTVVSAYDKLLAQGLIDARKNRGFFVREPRAARAEPPAAARREQPVQIDATALMRGMFHRVSDKPQPGMGVFPAAEWWPKVGARLRRARGRGVAPPLPMRPPFGGRDTKKDGTGCRPFV